MPTGDSVTNIFIKKLLSKTDLKDRLVDFLQAKLDEIIVALFNAQSGVVDPDTLDLNVGASPNQFSVNVTNANKVVTGDGHLITLPADVVGRTKDIQFENTASTVYFIGARYAQPVVKEIQINERTGRPEYPALEENFGELGAPSNVVDDPGVKITINVNNLTESGVDHSGRKVKIYLVNPVSGVLPTAFFEGTISFSTPNNTVVIPYSGSSGPLGQDTSSDPPSTTAAAYVVHVEGLSWFKNTDLRTVSTYAFLGTVTGHVSDPVFSVVDQETILLTSLDRAYDGTAGSGSGRVVNVDSGAIVLEGKPTLGDNLARAVLRADLRSTTEKYSSAFQALMSAGASATDHSAQGIQLALVIKKDDGTLLAHEPASLGAATNRITMTRSGVSHSGANISTSGFDFALLENFSTAALNGLYAISILVGTDQFDVVELDGTTTPSFPAETGIVTLLRARIWASDTGSTPNSVMLGGNPQATAGQIVLRIIGGDPSGSVAETMIEAGTDTGGSGRARVFGDGSAEFDGDVKGRNGSRFDTTGGLIIAAGSGGNTWLDIDPSAGQADPYDGFGVVPNMGGVKAFDGVHFLGLSSRGRLVRPTRLFEDFPYDPARFAIGGTGLPRWTQKQSGSGGTIQGNVSSAGGATTIPHGGYVNLRSGATAGNRVSLVGAEMFRLHTPGSGAFDRFVNFYARGAIDNISPGSIARVGIMQDEGSTRDFIGFRYNQATTFWEFVQQNGATDRVVVSSSQTNPGTAVVDTEYMDFYMQIDPDAAGTGLGPVKWWVEGMTAFTTTALVTTVAVGNFGAYLDAETGTAGNDIDLWCDFIEMWDEVLKERK